MNQKTDATNKEKLINALDSFFRKYRNAMLIVVIVLVVGGVSLIIVNQVDTAKQESVAILVEGAADLFSEWLNMEDGASKDKKETALTEQLKSVINDYPSSPVVQRAIFMRGNYYIQKKDWDNAIADFKNVISSFPKSDLAAESLLRIALCEEENGNNQGALDSYLSVEKKYPSYFKMPYALLSLGRILEKQGQVQQAAAYYEKLEKEYTLSAMSKIAQNRLIELRAEGLIEETSSIQE